MEVTSPQEGAARLELLKALADNTRFAIYEHLDAAGRSLTTADIAELLALHPNTVRPHLERMREVGLVQVSADATGEVGRPQHRYSIAVAPPPLGFAGTGGVERAVPGSPDVLASVDLPASPAVLAELVLTMARRMGARGVDAYEAGYEHGTARSARYSGAPSALEALVADLTGLGFEPSVAEASDHETAVVSFGQCPFAAYVDRYPELICTLHQGIVTGLVDDMGDARVVEFCDRAHRTPCRVAVGER